MFHSCSCWFIHRQAGLDSTNSNSSVHSSSEDEAEGGVAEEGSAAQGRMEADRGSVSSRPDSPVNHAANSIPIVAGGDTPKPVSTVTF